MTVGIILLLVSSNEPQSLSINMGKKELFAKLVRSDRRHNSNSLKCQLLEQNRDILVGLENGI